MVIVIPAYEPDFKFLHLVRSLRPHPVIAIDDGSGSAYSALFERARTLGAHVITLNRNRGKGFALKTGFAYARKHFPGQDVVCADSDGQHRPVDIVTVAAKLAEKTDAAMVLGARRFTGNVPLRSRFGNAVTRVAFRLATGRGLLDTQTGLRGYPSKMLEWLENVAGDRFEYETRLLLRAARERLPIEEVEIATVYLEGNASSHFRPVRDSLRIYRELFAFTASSLLSFGLDTVLLFTFAALTGRVALAAVAARLISATFNYTVNASVVFGRRPQRASALRYFALAVAVLALNVPLLSFLTSTIGSIVVAKVVTELLLFLIGYLAQRYLIFASTNRP